MKTHAMTRRRLALAVAVILALVVVLVVRLVDFQIVRAADLAERASDSRTLPVTVLGTRGEIYDANGVLLADSVVRYNIEVAPNIVGDISRRVDGAWVRISRADAFAELAEITGVPASEIAAKVDEDPQSKYALVAKEVSAAVFDQVSALNIPWVFFSQVPGRTYPQGAVAGNILGFLGTDGPGAGVELGQNACLASENGSEIYERGKDGVRIPGSTITTKPVVNGGDIALTIDSDLQWYAQQQLGAVAEAESAAWGVAIVLEVETGELKAVAEWPTVDPNEPGKSVSDTWTSRSFTAPYEPGSTMKPITAAMLLDKGLVTPTTQLTVPYRFQPNSNVNIHDAVSHGLVNLTMTGVLRDSSNVGISMLVDRMSAEDRHDYLTKFGLTQSSEVGFVGESNGYLSEPSTWDPQQNYTVMFGQGILPTAIQMASAYQTLGNDGRRLPVRLESTCTAADGTVTELGSGTARQVVSPDAAHQTLSMMETVATEGWLKDAVAIPGYRVATKTGTAEVAENGVYTSKRTFSVVGLAPAEDPKYVVLVSIRNPKLSGSTALVAPIFRKIMEQTLKTNRVAPSSIPAVNPPATW